jgi:hypothetical protein
VVRPSSARGRECFSAIPSARCKSYSNTSLDQVENIGRQGTANRNCSHFDDDRLWRASPTWPSATEQDPPQEADLSRCSSGTGWSLYEALRILSALLKTINIISLPPCFDRRVRETASCSGISALPQSGNKPLATTNSPRPRALSLAPLPALSPPIVMALSMRSRAPRML